MPPAQARNKPSTRSQAKSQEPELDEHRNLTRKKDLRRWHLSPPNSDLPVECTPNSQYAWLASVFPSVPNRHSTFHIPSVPPSSSVPNSQYAKFPVSLRFPFGSEQSRCSRRNQRLRRVHRQLGQLRREKFPRSLPQFGSASLRDVAMLAQSSKSLSSTAVHVILRLKRQSMYGSPKNCE